MSYGYFLCGHVFLYLKPHHTNAQHPHTHAHTGPPVAATAVNMAGINEASSEDVFQAVSVPPTQFIRWVTGENTLGINQGLLQLSTTMPEFRLAVRNWHDAEGVDKLLRQYTSQRVRKQRKSKLKPNKTHAVIEEEKENRQQLRSCLLEHAFDNSPLPQDWVTDLRKLTETYGGALADWDKKVRKGIRNTTSKSVSALKNASRYRLHLQNDQTVTWDEVGDRLTEFAENHGEEKGLAEFGLRVSTMQALARQIRGTIGGVCLEFDEDTTPAEREETVLALGRSFPVAVASFDGVLVVYDLHELEDQDWLDLINQDVLRRESERRKPNTTANPHSATKERDSSSAGGPNQGVTPLYQRFPQLIPTVCAFVKEAGMSAQAKEARDNSDCRVLAGGHPKPRSLENTGN